MRKESTMKRLLFGILVACTVLPMLRSAVSYNFSGSKGRLGDNLIAFSHALWVSYKRNTPLLYKPFKYSDDLVLSTLHIPFGSIEDHNFKDVITFPKHRGKKLDIFSLNTESDILYIVPFFSYKKAKSFHFDVNWEDEGFVKILRKEVAPLIEVQSVDIPEGRLAVAVHIRTGDGHDRTYQLRTGETSYFRKRYYDRKLPLKFPPNSFYIEQIRRMSEELNDQPIYVHIFTDHSNPKYFAELFTEQVGKSNITYGFREQGNMHNANVLDDFFAMATFEYFIRGDSNFAIMAEKLSHWKISIYPVAHKWEGETLIITHTEMATR